MAEFIDVNDLPPQLEKVMAMVEEGIDVFLTQDSVPRARLLPAGVPRPAGERVRGLHIGAIETSDDFDDPLPDEFWGGTPQS
jgi:antitoxin (DNA-binding transcriptional repressor) of toxin-antitoxin stability system